jgi:organic hydroperoxide reductase OsmC/OhrA
MTSASQVRRFEVAAASSGTFGRVLCSARNHHFVVDGPVQNGCPGEALTPPELFLSSIAACGVELVEVFARQDGIPLRRVAATARGTLDRGNQARADVTLMNTLSLELELTGVDDAQAAHLVARFKKT